MFSFSPPCLAIDVNWPYIEVTYIACKLFEVSIEPAHKSWQLALYPWLEPRALPKLISIPWSNHSLAIQVSLAEWMAGKPRIGLMAPNIAVVVIGIEWSSCSRGFN